MKNTAMALEGISESKIDKKILWFSKQSPGVRQRVLQKVMAKNTSKHNNIGDLISAITQVQDEIGMTTRRKNPDHNLEPLQEIHDLRLEKVRQNFPKKGKPKLQAIKRRFNTIRSLREKGTSWRDIEDYLRRFCNIDISHGYLRRAYNELCDTPTEYTKR